MVRIVGAVIHGGAFSYAVRFLSPLPNLLEDSRQADPRASHAACCPDHLAQHRYRELPTSPLRGYRTLHSAKSIGIKASLSLSLASHPSTDRHGYILSVDSG